MSTLRTEAEARAEYRKSLIFGETPTPNTYVLEQEAQEAINKLLCARTLKVLIMYSPNLFHFIERQSLKLDIHSLGAIDTSCYKYDARLFKKVEGEKVEVSSFVISFNEVAPINLLNISDFCAEIFKIIHKEKEYDGGSKSESKKFLDAVVDDYIDFRITE